MDGWMYGCMSVFMERWMDSSVDGLLNKKFNLDTYGKRRFSVSASFMEQPSSVVKIIII